MNIAAQKLELKRGIDGVLTNHVLRTIPVSALNAAKEAAQRMGTLNIGGAAVNNVDYYYLKGGKSIKILQNAIGDGDWDFQLKPVNTVYTNWTTAGGGAADELTRLHNGIISMLWTVADNCLNRANLDPGESVPSQNLINNGNQNDALHTDIRNVFQEVTQLKATRAGPHTSTHTL